MNVPSDNFKEPDRRDHETQVYLELEWPRYASDCWNGNERARKKEGKEGKEIERDKTSDHLQSATIASESIFVMNCGSVTPTVEPILLLQVYKFLPWPQPET